jgi:hypothetical protein
LAVQTLKYPSAPVRWFNQICKQCSCIRKNARKRNVILKVPVCLNAFIFGEIRTLSVTWIFSLDLLIFVSTNDADHSGCPVQVMKCLLPLNHWNRGFESRSGHGCLSAFLLCLCSVQVAGLWRDPFKASYQLSVRFVVSELIVNGNGPQSPIRQRRKRWINDKIF